MNPRRFIPVLILIALVIGGWTYYQQLPTKAAPVVFTASGTIEATQIHLSALQGGRVTTIKAKEGDTVKAGEILVTVYAAPSGATSAASAIKDVILSPIDGVVLYRSVELGEVAVPGAPMFTIADLSRLTLTVYVPEDRYGQMALGQTYPVTVDSFPEFYFKGTVSHIADQPEFTPRNVQTIDSRKNTVYAIRLDLEPTGGKLKPGMPADVNLQASK